MTHQQPANSMHIHLFEDCATASENLQSLIEAAGFHCHSYSSVECMLLSPQLQSADCIVVGSWDADLDAVSIFRRIREVGNAAPVILFAKNIGLQSAVLALRSGVNNILDFPPRLNEAVAAIRSAISEYSQKRGFAQKQLKYINRLSRLTLREKQVLKALLRGLPSKLVAVHLQISTRTVEVHRSNITKKLEAESISELLYLFAVNCGADLDCALRCDPDTNL